MPRTKKNEYMRQRRAALKARGICVDCQNTPAKEGRTLCDFCLEQRRVREKLRGMTLPLPFPIAGLPGPLPRL